MPAFYFSPKRQGGKLPKLPKYHHKRPKRGKGENGMKHRTAELKSRLEEDKRQLREAEAQARATKEGRDEGARARLAEAERLALWFHLQAVWLAFQLHRHGAKPDEEACQYVPERDCANCASDLPDCWLEAAGAVADSFLEDYAKERAQRA